MRSTSDSKFDRFLFGAAIPLRALTLILRHRDLLILSSAPLVSAILLFVFLLYSLLSGAWALVHSTYLSAVSGYEGWVFAGASLLIVMAIGFFSVAIFAFLISLLASPFNDFLAEKTEKRLGVEHSAPWSFSRLFRVFRMDLRKSILTVFGSIVFSAGMLIPVANAFFIVGSSLLYTFTFITYPQSRREQGLLSSIGWIRDNFFSSLGFGLVTLVLFAIPVVGFFALPISVVGGTILFCDSIKDRDLLS